MPFLAAAKKVEIVPLKIKIVSVKRGRSGARMAVRGNGRQKREGEN